MFLVIKQHIIYISHVTLSETKKLADNRPKKSRNKRNDPYKTKYVGLPKNINLVGLKLLCNKSVVA